MKNSAILINIERGSIVVEEDLIKAFQNKQISGTGLDVFTTEPLPAARPLLKMGNAIVSPTPQELPSIIQKESLGIFLFRI